MKDRPLTGQWAGFSFQAGFLVTPEGRRIGPDELQWLSLTCNIAREWSLAMSEMAGEIREKRVCDAAVVYMRDRVARRRQLASARHMHRG